MSQKDDGGPAFPQTTEAMKQWDDGGCTRTPITEGGMTLRDWFAGQALVGIIANPTWNARDLMLLGIGDGESLALAGRLAYRYADTMLVARNF